MSSLTLEQAAIMVDQALSHGISKAFKPLCVVVLDAGGHMLALKRDERASIMRPQIAISKASGIVPAPGGVLIRDAGGMLLGAVGISGDISENDELCAVAGIAAAGLIADTGACAS